MNTHTDRRRQSQIVLLILLLSILMDRFCISKIAPRLSGFVGINPIPVVFGIPVNLPITLGLIPILSAFAVVFFLFNFPYRHSRQAGALDQIKIKMWRVFVGIISIPVCMILSGVFYLLIRDHLSRGFRNGIESFGLNADVYLFYPTNSITHLRGGVVVLIGFLIGIYIFIKQLRSISSVSKQAELHVHHSSDRNEQPQHLGRKSTAA